MNAQVSEHADCAGPVAHPRPKGAAGTLGCEKLVQITGDSVTESRIGEAIEKRARQARRSHGNPSTVASPSRMRATAPSDERRTVKPDGVTW